MANMNKIFSSIVVGSNETNRGLAGSALASGAPTDIGTSILPVTKELTIAGGDNFADTGASQAERAQVKPATTNKVPRIYGNVVTGGVVVDAQKTNANTIFVTFALSVTRPTEFDQVINDYDSEDLGPPWGLYEIYRNRQTCEMQANVFTMGNAEPYGASASTVQVLSDIADPSNNTDISSANVINVWAWADAGGGAVASAQIFPYYPPGSSYRRAITQVMPNRSGTYSAKGLVTVVVEVDQYEAADIRDFGTFRFKIGTRGYYEKQANGDVVTNLLSNPAVALEDYVERLGYGEFELADGNLDADSFATWKAYCDETYYYAVETGETDPLGGTFYGTYGSYDIYSAPRWQINGFINTQGRLKQGIDNICEAGQGSFSYDIRRGKFKVLVNKPITNAEGANAFVFDNENIVSGIQYNSTDLYSLYNFADVTFPNIEQQDLADALVVKTPTADKLSNELPSGMNFQVNTVNDRPRAAQMANNSLKASRVANMATFEADYSTFEVEIGDFVKITDSGKGWNEKIFKVMRIAERQAQGGETTLAFNCLEHLPSTYEDVIYEATANKPFGTGLGTVENLIEDNELTFTDRYANVTVSLDSGNAYIIVDDPTSGNGNVYYANGTISQSDVSIADLDTLANISANYPDYDINNEGWIAFAAITNSNVEFDFSEIKFEGDSSYQTPAYTETVDTKTYINGENISTANVWTPFKLNKITSGDYTVTISAYKQEAVRKRPSQANVVTVSINDRVATGNALLDTFGPGTFITQTATATVPAGNNTVQTLVDPIQHDLIDIGLTDDFVLNYKYTPVYTTFAASSTVAFSLQGNITFVNNEDTSTHVFPIVGGGVQFTDITLSEAVNELGTERSHDVPFSGQAQFYGLDEQKWYASSANVSFVGCNGLTGGDFTDVSYTMKSQNRFYRN